MAELDGKIVLVTGAASGIGHATTERLLHSGARVFATDRNEELLRSRFAGREAVRCFKLNVTSAEDWAFVVDSVRRHEERLDCLVNNAGVMLTKPFFATTLEEFREVMTVNVESIWLGVKASLPLMQSTAGRSAAGSSVINISSIYGQIAGPLHTAYCSSKGAVRMLTKAMAFELAPLKIRVNSIHPGPVATPLGLGGLEDAVRAGRLPDMDTAVAAIAQKFPLGRWAVADDIAGGIAFLASDDSGFITGSELTIDGGYSVI
jgi:NAD(P)-dependent dehydrogenase (short-subunit alcohol dehydrogenase family)